jgi:protease-4
MLTGRAMSGPVREMMTALLDDQFARLVASVAEARGRGPGEVEALLDESPTEVSALAEGGWISGVKYEDEVIDLLRERNGDPKELRRLESAVYARVPPASLGLEGGRTIAVLRVTGAIVHGKDGFSPLFGRTVGSEDLIPLVRAARRDDRVAAVVLRVDSPGGSGLASDLIWREIRATAAKKPVVASLSDVAGSGGYYVAMAADAIVAAPSTLTGSIGVVMAKLNLQQMQEKYGWKREVLSRGRFAELDVTHRPMSEEERRRFEKLCRDFYARFVAKAAECRKMSAEELEAHARGRVWTGAMARERGLVDALGGLQAAVDLAREKAKIPAGEKVRLRELRKPVPLLQRLAQRAGGASLPLPTALPASLALPVEPPGELLPFGPLEPIALMDPAWWLGR